MSLRLPLCPLKGPFCQAQMPILGHVGGHKTSLVFYLLKKKKKRFKQAAKNVQINQAMMLYHQVTDISMVSDITSIILSEKKMERTVPEL